MKTMNDSTRTAPFSEETIKQEEDAFIHSYAAVGEGHTVRLLFALFRAHYWRLVRAALFYAVKSSPIWIVPLVTANAIDIAAGQRPGGVPALLTNLAFILVLLLLNIPLNYVYIREFSIARRHVEAGLRGAMVRKLQQLSIAFHKEMRSGRIQSKVMRDVEAVEGLSAQMFTTVWETVLNATIPMVVILTKNIVVFFIFLLTVPAAVLAMIPFRNKMRRRNREFRQEIETTSSDVMEMEELVAVTRAHALENLEINRMTGRIVEVAKRGYKLDVLQSFFGSVNWVIFMSFQMVCLFISSWMAFKGKITIGEISLYQTYFTSLVNRISGVIGMIPVFAKGGEALQSIGEILNCGDVENYHGKKKLPDLRGEYTFEQVGFCYEDDPRPVLRGLNLHVAAGETIALVGDSGSGKSTIVSLVVGYYRPTGGRLLIDGQDVRELDMRSYRQHIAIVPQNTILFSGSIRDNITYGCPDVSEKELRRVLDAACLTEVVAALPQGLDTQVGEHGDKLSGGQRQRIAIARALIRRPEVILFDEATSALDTVSEAAIQQAIDNLTRERTTFIVAHRLSTIRHADKIAVIREGVCVEYGTYDELMAKKGAFYTFKQLQS